MQYLPLMILALVLGGVILYLFTNSKIPFLGEGKLDARGNVQRDRAPPPDVDPDDAQANAIGDIAAGAFKFASQWWKGAKTA